MNNPKGEVIYFEPPRQRRARTPQNPSKSFVKLVIPVKKLPRPLDTIEKLLDNEKKRRERLEEIRRLQEMAEVAQLQKTPLINKNYKMKGEYVPPQGWLYLPTESEDTEMQQLKEKLGVNENYSFQPKINPTDQERVYEDLMKWKQEKEYKLAAKRLNQLNERDYHSHQPQIGEKSQKLAQAGRGTRPIYERLIEAGKSKEKNLIKKMNDEKRGMFSPTINDRSRRLANKDKLSKRKRGKVNNLEFWDAYSKSRKRARSAFSNPRRNHYPITMANRLKWDNMEKYPLPGRKDDPCPWYKSPYGKDYREGIDNIQTDETKFGKGPMWDRGGAERASDRYQVGEFYPLSAKGPPNTNFTIPLRSPKSSKRKKKLGFKKQKKESSLERRKRLFNDKEAARSVSRRNEGKQKKKVKNLVYNDYKRNSPLQSNKNLIPGNEVVGVVQTGGKKNNSSWTETAASTDRVNRHRNQYRSNNDDGRRFLYESILMNKKNANSPEGVKLSKLAEMKCNSPTKDPFRAHWSASYKKEGDRKIQLDVYSGQGVDKTCDEYYEIAAVAE